MTMLKVDIHRPIGEEDDSIACQGVMISAIEKDEKGKPQSIRVSIAGELTFMDLMVMTRMMVEHVEDVARTKFSMPSFDALDMLKKTMGHKDVLEDFDVSDVVAH